MGPEEAWQGPQVPLLAEVARSLALDQLAVDVVTAFEQHGVRDPILLKGATFARWLYTDGASRPYVDVDLLVHPADGDRAAIALAELGFERGPWVYEHDDTPHAVEWQHRSHAGSVDLHTTLYGSGLDRVGTVEVLRSRTEAFRLAGRDVLALDPVARTLHVVLHAAQDRKQAGKKLEDLARVLALPDAHWHEVVDVAGRLCALPALRAGLELTADGRRLAERLALPPVLDGEVRMRAAGASEAAVRFEHVRRLPTADRLRYVGERFWPSRTVLDPTGEHGWAWSVWARLRRLVCVLVRIPAALWSWWRLRRPEPSQ
jgi:hypothetical protein